MWLGGYFVMDFAWACEILLGGVISCCFATCWMLGLRKGRNQDTRWAEESVHVRRLKDLKPGICPVCKERDDHSLGSDNDVKEVPPKDDGQGEKIHQRRIPGSGESWPRGKEKVWPREVFLSKYGERFHLRPDCETLRQSTGVRRFSICLCCVKDFRGA